LFWYCDADGDDGDAMETVQKLINPTNYEYGRLHNDNAIRCRRFTAQQLEDRFGVAESLVTVRVHGLLAAVRWISTKEAVRTSEPTTNTEKQVGFPPELMRLIGSYCPAYCRHPLVISRQYDWHPSRLDEPIPMFYSDAMRLIVRKEEEKRALAQSSEPAAKRQRIGSVIGSASVVGSAMTSSLS